jgi:hypothetical protein
MMDAWIESEGQIQAAIVSHLASHAELRQSEALKDKMGCTRTKTKTFDTTAVA